MKLQNNVLKLKVRINSYLLDKNNLFCCDFARLANNFTHSVISKGQKIEPSTIPVILNVALSIRGCDEISIKNLLEQSNDN